MTPRFFEKLLKKKIFYYREVTWKLTLLLSKYEWSFLGEKERCNLKETVILNVFAKLEMKIIKRIQSYGSVKVCQFLLGKLL